jgi:vancomycin resistance protein YoaR
MRLLNSGASMRAEAGVEPIRRGRSIPARRGWPGLVRRSAKIAAAVVAALAVGLLAVGIVFAGSADRIAGGVTVGGLDVGGLTSEDAESRLAARAERLAAVPVRFQAGGRRWPIAPAQIALRGDWPAAVRAALDQGDGPIPLRGLRRAWLRLFGADVRPTATYEERTLERRLAAIAEEINVPGRQAALVLRNGEPLVVPGEAGRRLDREAATEIVVDALASFEREAVALPVVIDPPEVTQDALRPVAAQVRTALSAPVRFEYKGVHWFVPPAQIATFLQLPQGGESELGIGGPAAKRYFANLGEAVARPPREVDFTMTSSGRAKMIPSRDGRTLDVEATQRSFLAAALSTTNREAHLAVVAAEPELSTERAKALGITGLVGGYTTYYGGDPNRIHNVQLVSRLIDRHLIAPGSTFSFNRTTGERNAAKGFLEAPVVINGELENGIGGGVCQVSTTVFNAAYEAGLPITERRNHALYIDHYPLGRDATVNYPDTDLKFVNDTGHWLLLETIVGASSLTVRLYGTPVHREVVSEASPLRDVAPPPVKRIPDPHLYTGEQVVEEDGSPARAVSVRRMVYDRRGRLLYDTTWYSSYVSEPKVVRVGTKERPASTKPTPTTTQGGATGATTTSGTTTGR